MRLLDYLTGLISFLALPFIVWWGVNQSPHSAAALEARLQASALQALQRAGIDWAEVDMDGQTAILKGPAPSGDAAEEAARIVLRSSGQGGLLFGGVSQVENRVHGAAPVRPYVWSAEKSGSGQFVLSGHVPSKAARAALVMEAEAAANGPVEDRMIVAAGAPPGNWQGIARFAIVQMAELEAGSAVLEDHVLTLRGHASGDALRATLTASISGVAGPFRGVALIRGQPLWSATLKDGALILSGTVSGEADKRALLTLARRHFEGDVIDEMSVAASPAEDWIDGAKAGLAHFATFRSGVMTFDPAVNGFTFEGEAPASTLQFLHEDMVRTAGRWRFVMVAKAGMPDIAGSAFAGGRDCTDALNRLLSDDAVGFQADRTEFNRAAAPAMDELAAIARRCGGQGDLELKVDGDALAEARAAVLADFMERAGAQRPRIAAIGYGPVSAVEGMDSDADASPDRPLEFTAREQSGQ